MPSGAETPQQSVARVAATKTLIVALLVCASWSVQADGQLDPSFAEGQGMRPAIGGNDFRRAGVILNAPGGGYFVAGDGNFRTDPKQDDFDAFVTKIRDDGDNDVTFGALGSSLLSLNRVPNGEERERGRTELNSTWSGQLAVFVEADTQLSARRVP